MQKGIDYVVSIISYDHLMSLRRQGEAMPQEDGFHKHYARGKKTKPKDMAKVLATAVIATMGYLSPEFQEARAKAERLLSCKEYQIVAIEGKRALIGIECMIKGAPQYPSDDYFIKGTDRKI